tara:strand:+ start:2334 stop:3257 length:924 start_codon:yes stop_codon:yes gene_type:complete
MSGFVWDNKKEPHHERRKRIMKEVPEVKKLFGIDPLLKYKTLLLVAIQLLIPIYMPENIWIRVLILFFVSATISHILFLAIHEITHGLAFKSKTLNNILAIVANIPLVFPYAMAFRIYHGEHHWYQGKDGIDTDIPTEKEALLFSGFLGKLIWLVNQILFYAIRPLVVHPIKIDKWQVINLLVQIVCMTAYYFVAGWTGIVFLLLSIFIAGGLHPIAGHFIAEHYIFKEGQETYSYYGFLNKITFNVGYHNEHHDFPNIPGSRLPELKKMASAHYDNLYAHDSWTKVLWHFVTSQKINLFSRVKRNQ